MISTSVGKVKLTLEGRVRYFFFFFFGSDSEEEMAVEVIVGVGGERSGLTEMRMLDNFFNRKISEGRYFMFVFARLSSCR